MNTHQMSPGAGTGSAGGNNRTPTRKKREMTYHYAGKVHVRGLLRRVWRPRYLALGDDGYLRYHESIPPLFQQEGGLAAGMHHHSYSNTYSLHNTHRPKSILAILDGARTIDPNSVVDQHVALPQGVYGFVFRGRPVELYTTSTANNDTAGLGGGGGGNNNHTDREQAQGGGGALIVPSSPGNNDSQILKHSSAKEAVFNQIFPKGTNRRKAAQKIAKKAINPDVLCGFRPGSSINNCDGGPIRDNGGNMSRSSSSSSLVGYEQPLLDEDVMGEAITTEGNSSNHEWGRDSHESNNTMGSFQEVERSQVCTDLVGDNTMRNHNNNTSSHQRSSSQRKQNNAPSTTKSTIQVQVQASSIQSREYLCAVSTAEEAESWVVALRWAAEHRRRIRYGNNTAAPTTGRNESIHSSNAIAPNNVALSSAIPIVSSRNIDSGEQINRKTLNANQTRSNITNSQLDRMRDEEFPRVISPSEMNDTSHSKGSSKLSSETSGENINSTHTEVGSDSKASLTSLLIEQEGWCKTEPENKSKKPTVIEELQTTTTPGVNSLVMTTPDDHPLSELNLHTNNHNQDILARDDSMLPESSSSPKKHPNSPGGATMVVTKVSRLQLPQIFVGLENNTQMNKSDINWLPFKLPLPGDELILQYEIQLLLLRNCKPRTEMSVHPESIEERTIHKSLHDVIAIVRALMAKYKEGGENDPPTPQRKGGALPDLPQNETICLLDDVEATLLSCMESNKKSTNQTKMTMAELAHGTIADLSSSMCNAASSVEIVDQVMRKLSKDRGICSSRQFQQFLGLHATHDESSLAPTKSKTKTTKFAVSKTADAEQIVKKWLAQTDHPSTMSKLQLGLAITLRHAVGGPILSLVAVWSTARLASIMWCLVSGTGIIISIPFERYATLFVLSFFFGHYCGASSQANKRPEVKLEKRPATGVQPMPSPISISESKGDTFADELDDDHSTVVEEGASESDEETFIAETSTISSPIPLYPSNQGITCWSKPDHKIFMVRGPNYLEDRIKMPSAPAVFECRGVDVWITDNAERNIARHPSVLGGKIEEEHTFVVNFLLPFSNFVAYFSIPPIEEMPANIADVWTRFIKGDQQYRDRKLKLLPVVVDGPWIVKKAVGPGTSPAVIGRDLPLQYYFSEPTATRKGIYEVDVLVTASRIARGILNVVKGHTKSLTIAFAFIIEASEEAQLPETVLCAFQVHSLHLEDCPSLPDCYPDG